MEFQFWWLLAFPLFFALGWVAARVDIRHVVRDSRSLPRSYFKGLNFLVNEQPDKAIEAFLEAVKVEPETIELHFALGSLFRRRGETDRAIRMHQNLLLREDLGQDQRLHALLELGQDFLKAGLLDRAEESFLKLKDTELDETALDALLDIYQQEKEWQKAVEVASLQQVRTGRLWHREIANFYCELAFKEDASSRPEAARVLLGEALSANKRSVRANLMLGDLAAAAGDHEAAIEIWKRLEQQNPVYLALAAVRLLEAHRKLGKVAQALQLLQGYLERHPSVDLLDTVYQCQLEINGPDEAYQCVRDELRRNPTLLGLEKMLEARVQVAAPENRPDLELVKSLIHNHTRRVARYRCDHCGFQARQFYWHCPACGGWETYPPKRGEEFDLTP
jgi:lipopolysaccharide biosynthesis regulator YciM